MGTLKTYRLIFLLTNTTIFVAQNVENQIVFTLQVTVESSQFKEAFATQGQLRQALT